MLRQENATWWQADREIFPEDVAYIRTFVKRFRGLSRTELTCTLCEHLDWLTPAGQPKYTACAKLLARLEGGRGVASALAAERKKPSRSALLRTERGERSKRSSGALSGVFV
ncbi:MAG: hypothetical protein ACFCVA_03555 [Gammaproteobacteria bacterium]